MIFPIQYIYILNIIVIALLALFAYSGYRQGLLLKVIGCIGFVVVGFLAWFLSSPLGKLLHLLPANIAPMEDTIVGPIFYEMINRMVVFVVLFVLFSIVIILMKPILKTLGKLPVVHQVNTVLGTIFGFVQGVIMVMIITFVFATPLFANGSKVITGSFLSPVYQLTESALFFAEDTLGELQSVQKIVTPSTMLTETDVENIRSWLLRFDLPENQVDAFLHDVLGE